MASSSSRTYGWPLQALRLITLGLAVGLPIVLVLAWYHGDRGEQRIRGIELAIISPAKSMQPARS
jgi:hypothetical protein